MENDDNIIEGERGLEKALGKIGKSLDEFKRELKKKEGYNDFIVIEYHPANHTVFVKKSINSIIRIPISLPGFYNKKRGDFTENGQ